nr:probable proteasome inhibitor [Ipomoea batatas]
MIIRASRPTFRNPYDKVAFAVHASFVASGFVLLATGPSAFADDPFSSAFADEVGIDHWNDFEDNYGFIYSTPEGNSKKVLVKCLVMNGKLLVDALWEGTSTIRHLELNVQDYVENGGANYDSQYKNFGTLVEKINKEILRKGSPAVKSSTQSSRYVLFGLLSLLMNSCALKLACDLDTVVPIYA